MLSAMNVVVELVVLGLFLFSNSGQVLAHKLHTLVRHAPSILWGFWGKSVLAVTGLSLWFLSCVSSSVFSWESYRLCCSYVISVLDVVIAVLDVVIAVLDVVIAVLDVVIVCRRWGLRIHSRAE